MCIVDLLTFATCPHTTLLPLYPCTHFLPTPSPPTCRPIINKYLSAPTSTSCLPCHLSAIHTIRTDYARRYLSLEREARELGWCADDVRGEVMEMQGEMEKVITDLNVVGLRKETEENVDLRAFAESVRFQFGPGPVEFSAGCDRKALRPVMGRGGSMAKAKGKKMTRVQALRAEGRMSKCEESAPWVVELPMVSKPSGKRVAKLMGKGKGMTRVQVLRAEGSMSVCEENAPWACV